MGSWIRSFAVVAVLVVPAAAQAQTGPAHAGEVARGSRVAAASVHRLSLEGAFAGIPLSVQGAVPAPQTRPEVPSERRKSPWRHVAGASVGALGGFFGGGYLGAAIEGDRCNCDDPGLKGAVIGAPIGAVVGGILGGFFLF